MLMTNVAVQAAMQVFQQSIVDAESTVAYESAGNLLIIATSQQIEQLLPKLSERLHPAILFTDQCRPKLAATLLKADIPYINQVGNIQIKGYMGQFHIVADYQFDDDVLSDNQNQDQQNNDGEKEPSEGQFLSIHQLADVVFDLIVDLQPQPAITVDLPPPGYFYIADNSKQLEQLLEELSDWIGVFDKPKYYEHLSDRCVHSANRITGCTQCIDRCPTQAIQSSNGSIEVNPYLCQGCGDCVTTCPSGAMVYRYPSVEQLHNQLRKGLDAYYHADGIKPVVLFYSQENKNTVDWLQQHVDKLPEGTIPCAVESIAAYGLDTWLVTLAYGASSLILLSTDDDLAISMTLVDQQIAIFEAILQGMGITDCLLRRCTIETLPDITLAHLQLGRRATFAGVEDKRRMIRLAIDFLVDDNVNQPDVQALPDNALFGEVVVNGERCTLCMSCVSICPQAALLSGDGLPQLKFIETNCVQCGLCENACPESVISLHPRYLYDNELNRTPRMLHEDEVIACVQCGKPFIGAQMLASMFEKMADHPMYQGSQRSLLQMCGDCRVLALHSKQTHA
jgi:ferredoxin